MTALILVDLQNDFMPGGALPTKDGFAILSAVNKLVELPFDLIVATQDWHPPNHESFAATHRRQPGETIKLDAVSQILWPIHCVQNTYGAAFVTGWDTSKINTIIHKGTNPKIDSYSTFFDNAHLRSTGLYEHLKENKIHTIYLAGVATEYCVKYSSLDAVNLGFKVYVVTDACKGVNFHEDDVKEGLLVMQAAGVHLITSAELQLK